MQTTYSLDSAIGLPGQLADLNEKSVESFVAAEDLKPGMLVTLDTGSAELPKDTILGKTLGIVLLHDVLPQTLAGEVFYPAGTVVPVLRKGKAFAQYSGGTQVQKGAANVKHASDDTLGNAQHRGKITGSATSTTAGAEVSATSLVFDRNTGLSDLCVVEVNLP